MEAVTACAAMAQCSSAAKLIFAAEEKAVIS